MKPHGAFPAFDSGISRNGYGWWYVDAISDDARYGVTLIAMIGNVFSPYYARARRRGEADPANHCAVNVALYGGVRKRWALTERGRDRLERDAGHLRVGPTMLQWTGDALVIDVEEITVPLPSRLRGRITVHPQALTGHRAALDTRGRHHWSPIAPRARVEVQMQAPRLRWSGDGYLDFNTGNEPLEAGFQRWSWSRCTVDDGAAILYDVVQRDGERAPMALHIDRHGAVEPFASPAPTALPCTPVWRFPRETRSDPGTTAVVRRTLEDTPFYARSVLLSRLLGKPVESMHESVCLDRFDSAWVQMLLPFRMPRRAR